MFKKHILFYVKKEDDKLVYFLSIHNIYNEKMIDFL